MKYALLRCCITPGLMEQYEASTNAVLEKLGIGIDDRVGFNCCGHPLRNFNRKAYLLAASRNLALAEEKALNILTICNCCYGSLRHAEHALKEDDALRTDINKILDKEDLSITGTSTTRHLLDVLYDVVGPDAIEKKFTRTFAGLRIAVHYGCHLLRPKEIVSFDSPFAPVKLDRLTEITGAESVPWSAKLECCGASVLGSNEELAMDLAAKKIASARQAGADFLCVVCPYCHLQFDGAQKKMLARSGNGMDGGLPAVLYPQLLGLCMGIDEKTLGLENNRISLAGIHKFLR